MSEVSRYPMELFDEDKLQTIVWRKNDIAVIQLKRKQIAKALQATSATIKTGAVNSISKMDLELMFRFYDESFLFGALSAYPGQFKFSLSGRMTRSAGMTICPKNISTMKPEEVAIEIRIGVDFFYHYEQQEGVKAVGGCETTSALEALQLVFEHELCHAIEFLLFQKSSCSRQRFKTIAKNLFGHTQSHHQLPTHSSIAQQKLDVKLGDPVRFEYDGRVHNGILYKINKRATVMVRDQNGILVDQQGNRYAKYYVPISRLKGVDK